MKSEFKERYQRIFVWPRKEVSSPDSSRLPNLSAAARGSHCPHRPVPRLKLNFDFTATREPEDISSPDSSRLHAAAAPAGATALTVSFLGPRLKFHLYFTATCSRHGHRVC